MLQAIAQVHPIDEVLFKISFIEPFLNLLTKVLNHLLQSAIQAVDKSQHVVDLDSLWQLEAVDHILDAWCKWSTKILDKTQTTPTSEVMQLRNTARKHSQV